ncbi:hypothetical protein COW80_04885 [Candidatus Beckwithbacteria bacterium CG22_combo_CG10-13_8_21_14_all_01_47_9]|uniref:YrhK domain-containing protein n=5 Tax=Candidatus Beckwithiibacteriota TaxID=1752726 RepID=A0A2H0E041_9BACT|nr:MAG: hypothetical protein AUJ59_00580 [Candidatus Beckwithbacteria bacterium CG1_02_47_37]PIP51771.1 MAG: hypothetical protein COX09_05235 [Candidatus Beckwithbacteria bacterium CG23_combo_of_CG06-09_8_20_14_all_47_9]PIP87601.1 MAG: hypothetical protein COW80_04885 [Candidatus Beckwithbacteria bacterium CG22_combo_CG10-13_8_21_14_all_01_47_9]PJA23330.1 MAG: hypothetical protein COX59_00465 [Candidatus Beckwithbacteria bacterium CG_4_10_14_0_2_um_filter_47_25]PJC66725.1 MAG: hypothetical prot
MKKLSVAQKKSLAEFFTNSAVAWLTVGIIAPLFTEKTLPNFISSLVWGILLTSTFMLVSLQITRGVRS